MARGEKRRQTRYADPCRVYWGSHGCDKARGHGGEHICFGCGPPYVMTPSVAAYRGDYPHGHPADVTLNPGTFYGEDVELYQVLAMEC